MLAFCSNVSAQCGDPKAGDCAIANGTPYCDDLKCCEDVCETDPFCCVIEWDGNCVNGTWVCGNKVVCGQPDAGPCSQANGTPGCSNLYCCLLVCEIDPFCCEVQWDQLCAKEEDDCLCEILIGGFCENPYPLKNTGASFSIEFAVYGCDITDGPPLPPSCDEGFGLSFEHDLWITYLADCSGFVTVSTCNDANFNTRLAAYTGDCDDLQIIACNDDATGCAMRSSVMSFEAIKGISYILRIGSYGELGGLGVLTITNDGCPRKDCPWDLDGSGSVGTSDLLELLAQWGTPGTADFDESGAVSTSDLLILLANWGICQ